MVLDMVAVLPRMRDLKPRLKMGFAPTGVLVHLFDEEWTPFERVVARTGYDPDLVGGLLEEAVRNGWVEVGKDENGPCFKLRNYRVPAKDCVVVFSGARGFTEKLDTVNRLKGAYNSALFIFPYDLDDETTEMIVSSGYGLVRYYQRHGIFQVLVPADRFDIEDPKRHALIVEKILYDNVWIMTEAII